MFTTKERTQTKLTRNVYAEQRVISLTQHNGLRQILS